MRAADILVENDVFIEIGPHKHSIGQSIFLYFYEPGGNRVEVGAGGYLILDPDWKPVVWSREERMKGQAWGPADCQHVSHLRYAACGLNSTENVLEILRWISNV